MKYLSYFISERTPLYGNGTGIQFLSDKEMNKGDSCNTTNLVFPNHSGTHIDFPYHFNMDGKTLNDYPASYWQFDHIDLIDLLVLNFQSFQFLMSFFYFIYESVKNNFFSFIII